MKYIVPQDKLDKIVFKYLDLNLRGLEKRKPRFYNGILFAFPDDDHGILGWWGDNVGELYVFYNLNWEISSTFNLIDSESLKLIGRWVSDRYKLKVTKTILCLMRSDSALVID
jgi:hypothetical protein